MRTLGLLLAALAAAAPARADDGEATARLDRLAREAGVEIVRAPVDLDVETPFGPITAKPAGDGASAFIPILADEFAAYPPALVRRARLRRMVLCTGLAFDGQLRGAIPDFWHDDLYLDVARGRHSRTYQRTAIHHEFYHLVDYRDDGEVYRDDAWSALNPPGFRYGPGGANVQDDALGMLFTDARPGFLTLYATSGVEEDKAEVFSRMLTSPREVARRAGADPVVARKVARLKELMRKFEPTLDDSFWRRVEARPDAVPDPAPAPKQAVAS